MDFGTPSKFDVARRVAAAMAYVGLINMDRVSIVSWSDGVLEQMPARRGKQQVWRTLHFLDRLQPAGRTDLLNTVTSYFGASRTRGLVIVISDFIDRDGWSGVSSSCALIATSCSCFTCNRAKKTYRFWATR